MTTTTKWQPQKTGGSTILPATKIRFFNASWLLNSMLDFMMGIGSVDHKADKQKKREEEYKKKEEEQNRIGQHHRELNPFWKDGGTGLPPTEEELQKKKEEERRAERRRLQAQLQNEPRKNTFSGKFSHFEDISDIFL